MSCENQTLGLVEVRFNGILFEIQQGSAEINFGGQVAKENSLTDSGGYYPSFTNEPCEVKFETPLTKDFDLDALRGQCGVLTVLCDNGVTYVSTTAALSETISGKSGEGRASVQFSGAPLEQI
jgi:hypothetical protein